MASSILKLYGVPLSQPVRQVAWALTIKGVPFTLQLVSPGAKGKGGTRDSSFPHPGRTVPILEDDGFVLGEGNAILCYLANKHQWNDLYPADATSRGQVDWYLHWHHQNIRPMTKAVFVKAARPDIAPSEDVQKTSLTVFNKAVAMLDEHILSASKYLVSDEFTVADLACYCELGQFGPDYGNVYDFSRFPNVARWMTDMKDVPFHDEM